MNTQFNNQIQSIGHVLWPGLDKVRTEDKIVSLVPIIVNKHGHVPRATVTSFVDDKGHYYGIPIKKMPDGTYKYKRHVIEGNAMFDLRDINQAKDFAIVSRAPFVEGSIGSKRAGSGQPTYKILDPNVEAVKKVDYYKRFAKAIGIIENLTSEELLNMSMVIIGAQAIHNKPEMNKQFLGDSAQTNPSKILAYAQDKQQSELQVIFKTAFSTGLINYTENVGYRTATGHVLGMTEPAAINSLARNPKLTLSLQIEAKEAMKDVIKNHTLSPEPPSEQQQLLGSGYKTGNDVNVDLTDWENEDDGDANPDKEYVDKLLKGSQ